MLSNVSAWSWIFSAYKWKFIYHFKCDECFQKTIFKIPFYSALIVIDGHFLDVKYNFSDAILAANVFYLGINSDSLVYMCNVTCSL